MRATLLIVLAAAGISCGGSEPSPPAAPAATTTPATGNAGTNPAPEDSGDWIRPAKDYAATRFSNLDQITADTVRQLGVKGTFSTGFVRGHEAAPLVVNNTMYIVTPFPNVVYALDLTKPGTPPKWSYNPKPLGAAQGVACCDVVNRGAVYDNGTLFFNTLRRRDGSIRSSISSWPASSCGSPPASC